VCARVGGVTEWNRRVYGGGTDDRRRRRRRRARVSMATRPGGTGRVPVSWTLTNDGRPEPEPSSARRRLARARRVRAP